MTDVIDRVRGGSVDGFSEFEPVPAESLSEDRARGLRPGPVEVLLSLTLGCAAVLLMANSSHLSGWKAGLAIAVAWLQISLAVVCLARPTVPVTVVTTVVALLGLGTWVSAIDGTSLPRSVLWVGVGLTATAFFTALLVSVVPTLGKRWSPPTLVLASLIPLAVVVVTTIALLAPPTIPPVHAAGAPQSFASTSAALALKTTAPVPGQNTPQFKRILAGNASEQTELKPYVPLSAADLAVLNQQLTQALLAAERFPTVASAKAAGMILAGGMAPGVGAHYQSITGRGLSGQFDPSQPGSWIYASTADNAPVVGVMYISLAAQPPAGFIGPNDHWHQHSNVCIKFGGGQINVPFAPDQNVTPQECADVHGIFMKKTVWMVHAWVVPGWESPQGVFSHDNLHVYCPGNTDLVDAIGVCTRQQ